MSNLVKIRRKLKPRSVVRSIKGLFVPKKGVNPSKRYPDIYYRAMYCTKSKFKGIEHIAKILKVSKMEVHDDLLARGISSLLGEAIIEDARAAIAAAEAGKRYWHNRAVRELRKWAEENGYDLSDINKVAVVQTPNV